MAETPNLGLPLIDSNMTADVPRDVNALANAVDAAVGDMSSVPTDAKDAAGAISELFQSVSDGKALVAAAITDKGVSTAADDSFAEMASNIDAIQVGPDTSDATAGPTDILTLKTAYGADGNKMTGTMPNRGAVNITPGAFAQPIPNGYHNGNGQVAAVSNLVAGNIKDGTVVGGITGTFTDTSSPASASQILTGRVSFANGIQINGTMPNRAGDTAALASSVAGTTLKLRASEGYRDGVDDNVTITDAEFISANIRKGINLFGLEGTLVPGKQFAVKTLPKPNNGSMPMTFQSAPLGFTPSYLSTFVILGSIGGWGGTGTNSRGTVTNLNATRFYAEINGHHYTIDIYLSYNAGNNTITISYYGPDAVTLGNSGDFTFYFFE